MDYVKIKDIAHAMRSSMSTMRISVLLPILEEMEALGISSSNIGRIIELNKKLDSICKQALVEIEKEKNNYN